MPGNNA